MAWTPPSLPDSIVLLADYIRYLSAEIVPGGATFTLRHSGYSSCGISDGETFIVTGGYPYHDYVTRYNINGFVEELPQMLEKRRTHACAAHPATGALFVAGGANEAGSLSSVLTLLPGATAWTPLASLPRKLHGHQATFVGGSLRMTGGFYQWSYRSEVLEYQPEPSNQWVSIGNLQIGRCLHAALSIGPQQLPCLSETFG